MESKDNSIVIIKSGNGNKSIGSYVDIISNKLIENLEIELIAYDNNMNKLITIEQIIKRALVQNKDKEIFDYDSKINYEIGKDKNIPFIKCSIKINKDDIFNLKTLIGNKKNKRNNRPFTKDENKDQMHIEENNNNKYKKPKLDIDFKEEDKINDLCIKNIQEFFK